MSFSDFSKLVKKPELVDAAKEVVLSPEESVAEEEVAEPVVVEDPLLRQKVLLEGLEEEKREYEKLLTNLMDATIPLESPAAGDVHDGIPEVITPQVIAESAGRYDPATVRMVQDWMTHQLYKSPHIGSILYYPVVETLRDLVEGINAIKVYTEANTKIDDAVLSEEEKALEKIREWRYRIEQVKDLTPKQTTQERLRDELEECFIRKIISLVLSGNIDITATIETQRKIAEAVDEALKILRALRLGIRVIIISQVNAVAKTLIPKIINAFKNRLMRQVLYQTMALAGEVERKISQPLVATIERLFNDIGEETCGVFNELSYELFTMISIRRNKYMTQLRAWAEDQLKISDSRVALLETLEIRHKYAIQLEALDKAIEILEQVRSLENFSELLYDALIKSKRKPKSVDELTKPEASSPERAKTP